MSADELNTDLLASHWTWCGDSAPFVGDETSPLDIRTRIETAARVGYQGVGLLHTDLLKEKSALGWSTIASILQDNGIRNVELELIGDWWTEGPTRQASDRIRAELFEAAPIFGVRNIKVGALKSETVYPAQRYVEEFDALATQAQAAGLRIALEPLPMAHFSTIHEAVELVTAAGNPAGGLCVDIWHMARAGTSYEEMVKVIPAQQLFVVELNDAAAEVVGTLWNDTINERLYPGQGALDVVGFVRAIRSLGYQGCWGVEILSTLHRSLPLEEALTRAYRTTQAVLAQAAQD